MKHMKHPHHPPVVSPVYFDTVFNQGVIPPNWSQHIGNVQPDYNYISPVGGFRCVRLPANSSAQNFTLAPKPEVYTKLLCLFTALPSGSAYGYEVLDIYGKQASGYPQEICDAYLQSDGGLKLAMNAGNGTTAAMPPLNKWINLFMHYKKTTTEYSEGSIAWALEGEPCPITGPQFYKTFGYWQLDVIGPLLGPVVGPGELLVREIAFSTQPFA